MKWPTLQHCRDYGVTWWEHCCRSLRWAWTLQKSVICLAIHSVFPWVFETYASSSLIKVVSEMEEISQEKQ